MCRFCELPGIGDGVDAATGMPHFGKAEYFFSYSWDSPWDQILEGLTAHSDAIVKKHPDRPPPYYWLDIFAVCQHWRTDSNNAGKQGFMAAACSDTCPGCKAVAADMHDWATADPANPKGFERVIAHTNKTVMLMEPWSTT